MAIIAGFIWASKQAMNVSATERAKKKHGKKPKTVQMVSKTQVEPMRNKGGQQSEKESKEIALLYEQKKTPNSVLHVAK